MELDRSIVEGVNKANKKLGEFFYLLANEPSVGLYHVQEHIRKTIPKNTEMKREIRKKYQNIEAMTYDVNFSIQTVKSLHDLTTFQTIKETMDNCINMLNSLNKGQPAARKGSAITTPTFTSRPPVLTHPPTTSRESSILPSTQPKSESPHPIRAESASNEEKSETTTDVNTSSAVPSTPSDPTRANEDESNDTTDNGINTESEEGLVHKKVKKTKKSKVAKKPLKKFRLNSKTILENKLA
eukprot:Phypoly_transcript_16650.p1 GENE.Phypoly_transcript_16650~~Phypoly_transcript_16650.p1  ORF type:complete len:241 (+),score=35.44 Phypoly_transcript_16650:128-850(+)